MPGSKKEKKKGNILATFADLLKGSSPAAVAKLGQEKGGTLKMKAKKNRRSSETVKTLPKAVPPKKKKPPKKKRPTGNIQKEKKVRGDKKAQESFRKFIESELESQNPK